MVKVLNVFLQLPFASVFPFTIPQKLEAFVPIDSVLGGGRVLISTEEGKLPKTPEEVKRRMR
jgi:hypothetical protein